MGNFPAPFDDGYEEAGLANWVGAAANSAKLDRGEPIFLAGLDVGAIFAVGEVYYGAGTSVVIFTEALSFVCTRKMACVKVALSTVFSFGPPLLRKRRFLLSGFIFSLSSLMRTCFIVHSFCARALSHSESEELELSWCGLNSL